MKNEEIKKELKITNYKDATVGKLPNRRIIISQTNQERNEISFVRMVKSKKDLENQSCNFEVIKDKICITSLGLSNEGLESLHILIGEYLKNVKK